MTTEILSIMRHEVVLTLLFLVFLIWKLIRPDEKQNHNTLVFINVALFLNLVIGFLPFTAGTLFSEMYVTDSVLVLEKNILNLGTLIVSFQAYDWLKNNKHAIEYYLLLLSALLGMFFIISSGNFLMFYLGLELATIPIAALASFEKDKLRSAEAGIKLMLNSAFSSGLLLFGLSLIYGTTGSLNFNVVAEAITGNELQILALILIFAGFAFKIAIVPFHFWAADVYEGAPVTITAYLSVISKSAVIFVLLSVLYKVFHQMIEVWLNILFITSVLSMTIGNLFAIRQNNLKRFLAFSSIAQAGYILLGIMGSSELGMSSVIFFVLIYIFSNLGAFGVVSSIAATTGKETISDYKGLYLTNPKLSLLMLLAMFSLAGVPPTAGFFGKFFLLAAAAGKGYYILLIIATLNMVISLYYYLMIVKAMFIDKSEEPVETIISSGFSKLGLVVCGLGIIVVGFISGIFDFIYSISYGV